MLVNTIIALSMWGLCIRILLISSFLLIPIVKNVLENSKISRTAEPSNGYSMYVRYANVMYCTADSVCGVVVIARNEVVEHHLRRRTVDTADARSNSSSFRTVR